MCFMCAKIQRCRSKLHSFKGKCVLLFYLLYFREHLFTERKFCWLLKIAEEHGYEQASGFWEGDVALRHLADIQMC